MKVVTMNVLAAAILLMRCDCFGSATDVLPHTDARAVASTHSANWADWLHALARAANQGHRVEVGPTAPGSLPSHWKLRRAGDLALAVELTSEGARLRSLYDLAARQEFLATNQPAMFAVKLFNVRTRKQVDLTADGGWQQVAFHSSANGFSLHWAKPTDAELRELSVAATARLDSRGQAIHWRLAVNFPSREWSVWRVSFPQLQLADLGRGAGVLFPRGPGEVQQDLWTRPFNYHGQYPGGWCSMQFVAAYRDPSNSTRPSVSDANAPINSEIENRNQTRPTGLYVGLHDPWGSTKDINLKSDPTNHCLLVSVEHPAPNMGVAGNDFVLSGEVAWELMRGDWFDAAVIYKSWARQHARWWPKLTRSGRKDTPLWMRELCAWAMTGGKPADSAAAVRRFQEFLGVPVGFHWYNWHEIPFDNDYPHYFPAKDGFAAGVRELQTNQVMVMPYINGRLWDTHDRGAHDYEFTTKALPAASKDQTGKPYLEKYGSKETNGNPVQLAVMCPATPSWQQTVRGIVLRLLKDCGTKSVYIDQIAAAPPTFCQDPRHGHPLGGGHWWTEGYWKLLESIRKAMPADAMLTTECNGEPYIRWLDGYLTWHWQYNGQVPAFPAVYGGALQMFGRAYRGGATKDLALRMKAGQELVFGEQIGWIDPNVVKEATNAAFFREVVQTRYQFRQYFYEGEMARPPKLAGPMPTVKADWQWSGEWPVTTDAVLTGAWQIPHQKRLLLLFVNVSNEPVAANLLVDPATYGIKARQMRWRSWQNGEMQDERTTLADRLERRMLLPPGRTLAWEFY